MLDCWAGRINFAPSTTRTPRYWKLPSGALHIATRALEVLPNTTAVLGDAHRAVESM